MLRRLLGSILFLFPALCLFEIAGRLASEEKGGWGWFLFAGLIVCGVAVNLWAGEKPAHQCTCCGKPQRLDELE